MSKSVLPGQQFTADADVGRTGLAGIIGVTIRTTDGTVITARTTAGITETAAGSGVYEKTDLIGPNDPGSDYELYWDDGATPPAYATEELEVVGAEWRPSIAAVSALEHSRTTVLGEEVGIFNDDTEPTATQVNNLITIAVADVRSAVGISIPDKYFDDARAAAALRAASLVESSYFPREIDSDRSPYKQYTAQYLDAVESLSARIPRALRLT